MSVCLLNSNMHPAQLNNSSKNNKKICFLDFPLTIGASSTASDTAYAGRRAQ